MEKSGEDTDNETESLHSFLVRRIAEKEGLKPEEITTDYIHKQRQERFYPTTRYDIGTKIGGYDITGLTFLTGQQIDGINKSADDFLKEYQR